jgi:hypothetical protein
MRSISGTLAAAQKARVRRPYLRVIVSDRHANIRRLRWTQWYAGAEPDNGHAAVVAADGSLIRARFDGTTLYRSRVTTPVIGSDYSIWTAWTPPVTPKANLIAFAKAGSTLWAFVINNADNKQTYAATSTDNGATWSAFALAFTAIENITAIAAAGKSDGNVAVITIQTGDNLIAHRWNGSTWTAYPGPTTPTFNGVAVHHSGDWNIVATDEDTAAVLPVRELRSYRFGDGFSQATNTWSSGVVIQSALTASGIDFARPYLGRPDVFRATFRQQFTGSVAYDRTHHTYQPATAAYADNLWREPVPLNIVAAFGVAISYDAAQVFLTTARYVYQAAIADGATDLTDRVISADMNETGGPPALSEIVLDNADGAYTVPGSGAAAALTKGAWITVSPGYVSSSGNEFSAGPAYYVEGFRHVYEGGRAVVKITLGAAWTHLARHRFPRAVEFAAGAKNVFGQLQHIAARVGYELSSSGASAASANLYPPLGLPPGTSALTAIRRILDRVPDRLFARGEFLFLNEPLAADTADATYGRPLTTENQEITAAEYGDTLKDANHAQVFAAADGTIVAEDVDYTETALLYSAPRQRADPFLTAGADATARAAAEQRRQTIDTTRGDQITAPVHCGLEVNDVIAVTDTRHGLSAAKRRVLSLRTLYRRGPGGKARYDHQIELGAP